MSYLKFAYPEQSYLNSVQNDSIAGPTNAAPNSSVYPDGRVKSSIFWENYPHYGYLDEESYSTKQVYEIAGGNILEGHNNGDYIFSCALRVSIALNKSGFLIPRIKDLQTNYNYSDKKNYIISAYHLQIYLSRVFGVPDLHIESDTDLVSLKNSLKDGQVAIVAASGHAGAVRNNYQDPHTPTNKMSVWKLPI